MARIAEVAFFTDDVPKLAGFYERVLGAPPVTSSETHASFEVGGTILFIHVSGDTNHGVPNADHVAFALDQDAAAARAREAGAEVIGPRYFYWGRSAYLRDPEGRLLELQAES